MRKILIILNLLIISIFSMAQDIPPTGPNFKALQSVSWKFNTPDTTVWMYKGSTYGWTELASKKMLIFKIDSLGNYVDDSFLKLNQSTPQSVINGSPTFEGLQFDITPTTANIAEGLLRWNPTDGTLDLGQGLNGIVTQQVGQELFIKVVNKTAATLSEGSVVYFDGRLGNRAKAVLALGNTEATSNVMGVVTENIAVNAEGFITAVGYVRGIKTNYTGTGTWGTTWVEGDRLFLSKTVPGQLTNIEPLAPHHSDQVGEVGIVHSNLGSIFVGIQRHKTLEELSDVNGTPLATTGQFPVWDNVNKYFDFNYNITGYQNYHGIFNRAESTLSYNSTTRTISVAPVSTNWRYFFEGKPYDISTTISQSHANVTGNYYLYYNTANTITMSSTPWSILSDVLIASVYYNASLSLGVIFDERHGYNRNRPSHLEFHETIGAYKVPNSGFGIAGYTVQPVAPTDDNNTFELTSGIIADEDVRHQLAALADNGPYKVFYKTGAAGTWSWESNAVPYTWDTYMEYNEWTGTVWQLTDVPVNDFVNIWVCKIGAVESQYQTILIIDQDVHDNFAEADAQRLSDMNFDMFPIAESVVIYKIMFQTGAAYSSTGKCRIYGIYDEVKSLDGTSGSPATSTVHNSLTGLDGGQIGYYGHLNQIEKNRVTNFKDSVRANELDGDTLNEIQDLSIANDTLYLSGDSTPVSLTPYINPPLTTYVQNLGISTDNAIARFDLATGKFIQNSVVTISDVGVISSPESFLSQGISKNSYYGSIDALNDGAYVSYGLTNSAPGWQGTGYYMSLDGLGFKFSSGGVVTPPFSTITDLFTVGSSGAGIFKSTVQATTGKFTNLTDGFIPYHISDASGLANSVIKQVASNILIGTEVNDLINKVQIIGTVTHDPAIYSNQSATLGQITQAVADIGGSYIKNQFSSPQSSANMWIDGNGIFGGSLKTTTFQMTASPMLNYFMKSDVAGNGSWSLIDTSNVNGLYTYIQNNAPASDSKWNQGFNSIFPKTITDEVRIGSDTDYGNYKLSVAGNSFFTGGVLTTANLTSIFGIKMSDIETTGPTPDLGYGGMYVKYDSLWYVRDNGTAYNLLRINTISDYVTVPTNQDITGTKTFVSPDGNVYIRSTNAGDTGSGLFVGDETGTTKFQIGYNNSSDQSFLYSAGNRLRFLMGDTNEKMSIETTGQIKMPYYGDGLFTGTATKYAAWDINGNLIEASPIGSQWIDDTYGIYYNSNVGIGVSSTSSSKLYSYSSSASVYSGYFRNSSSGGAGVLIRAGLSKTYPALKIQNTSGTEYFSLYGDGTIAMKAVTQSDTPAAGTGYLYSNSGNSDKLYWKTNTGTYDLTEIGGGTPFVYPSSGIPVSTGTAWATSASSSIGGQLLRRNIGNTGYEFFTPSYLTTEADGNPTNEIQSLTYIPSTRTLDLSLTAGDAVLPLFDKLSTNAGLVPGSNNLSSAYFINALGNWAIPSANGASGWTDDGQFVRLTTSADLISIGVNNGPTERKVNIVADASLNVGLSVETDASQTYDEAIIGTAKGSSGNSGVGVTGIAVSGFGVRAEGSVADVLIDGSGVLSMVDVSSYSPPVSQLSGGSTNYLLSKDNDIIFSDRLGVERSLTSGTGNSFARFPMLQTDFLGTASGSASEAVIGLDYTSILSGTYANVQSQSNHPGIISISSSTSSNSGAYIRSFNTSILISDGEVFEAVFQAKVPSNTNTTIRMGFFDTSASTDATDGIYVELAPGSLNLVGKTSYGGVRASSPVIATLTVDSWYRIKIEFDAPATVTYTLFNSLGVEIADEVFVAAVPNQIGEETGVGIIATNFGLTPTVLAYFDMVSFYYKKALIR